MEEHITHHTITPYKPNSNGKIERFNQMIMNMAKKNKGKLEDKLKKAINTYNNLLHKSTKMKPNDVFPIDESFKSYFEDAGFRKEIEGNIEK